MKNHRLLLVLTSFLGLLLIAFSSSPPNGNTGAPGEGVCSSCHGGSNPLGLDGAVVISGPGPSVLAGETYIVSVLVDNPNGLAQRAGFQIVALDENNNNIGTLSNPSTSSTISSSGGRTYFKHNPAVDFPSSNEVEWTVEWTAPSNPTSTTVNFYGAGNIADGNNSSSNDFIVTTLLSVDIEIPPQPLEVEIVSSSDVSCFGGFDGSAEAQASGGSGGGYSYLWSNAETGPIAIQLSAGIQSVTVTDDAGATAESSVVILEPDLIELALIELIHVSCENGSDGAITVEASGGVSPFNFSWSDGSVGPEISNLPAGEYQLTVADENGCTATSFYLILDGNPIEVTSFQENVSCNGGGDGEIVLIPSGDNPPFTAFWSHGDFGLEISGLSAGIYSATVTDVAGCETVEVVEIVEPGPIEVNAATTDVSCNNGNDGSVTLSPTGDQPPFTAIWSNGHEGLTNSNLTAGTYQFTITDATECEIQGSEEVSEPGSIQISMTANQPSCGSCNDGSISASVSGGTGSYSFLWNTDPPQTSPTAVNLSPANYSLTVTDENDCTAIAVFELQAEGSCDSILPYFFNQTNIICDLNNVEGYCFYMGPPTEDPVPWPGCEGCCALYNPQWLTFVAGSDSINFTLEISECLSSLGVQIAVYELPPDIPYDPNESALTPDADWLIGDCSLVTSVQSGSISFGVETNPGSTYGLVFDGWTGDQCKIEILQVEGAVAAPDLMVSDPPMPVFDNDGFGTGDTICQGAVEVPFFLVEAVEGASFYLWTIDGQEISNEGNPLEVSIDFPGAGVYQICVHAANSCIASGPGCIEVFVQPLPELILEDTICSRETFWWIGPFGPVGDTLGPFSTPGDYEFSDTVSNSQGCLMDMSLFLHVIPDNYDAPTQLFDVICWDSDPVFVPFEGHPQAQFFQMTGIYGEDKSLFITQENFVGNQFACDSFFILELLVLDVLIGPLDFNCSENAAVIFPGSDIILPGLEAYSDDITVRYEWSREIDGSILKSGIWSDSSDLVLMVEFSEFLEDVEIYTLHLFSSNSEDPDTECENQYSIELVPEELVSLDLTINGPDTILTNQDFIFQVEELVGAATLFSWSFDPEPEDVVIDFSTRAVNLVYSEAGIVEICVSAENFCGIEDRVCIEVVVDTEVAVPYFPHEELNLRVYPNPFDEILYVHSDTKIGSATWEIYSSVGLPVLSGEGEYEKNIVISMKSLPSGVYLLHLNLDEGPVTYKVVKQK